jgi:hypothetical protein
MNRMRCEYVRIPLVVTALCATRKGEPSYFERLAAVELTLKPSGTDYQRPGYQLVGQSYTAKAGSLLQELTVTFANQGKAPAPTDGLSMRYLVLDDDGSALDWGFMHAADSGDVAPGKTVTGTTDISFSGSGRRIAVLADY